MKKADIVIGILILFLCVSIFISTQKFVGTSYTGYGPDRFPRFIAVIWGFLSIVLIVKAMRGKFINEEMKMTWVGLRKPLVFMAITVATLILMRYVGFLFSVLIYIFTLMTYLGEKGVISRICLSIGIGSGIYVLFRYVMVIPLPEFRLFQM